MKLNKILLYTFICLIIWLVMSYSSLGNFEFFVLFIIFASYLVFLLWQGQGKERFVNVSEEIQTLVANNEITISLLKQKDVVIEEEVHHVEEEVQSIFSNTMSLLKDLKKMPGEIKQRFGAELDRLTYNISPKTPRGEYVNTISIDDEYFKPSKNAMTSKYPGNFSIDEIKKLKIEYMMVDLIFRELYHYNKDSYNKLFYP